MLFLAMSNQNIYTVLNGMKFHLLQKVNVSNYPCCHTAGYAVLPDMILFVSQTNFNSYPGWPCFASVNSLLTES